MGVAAGLLLLTFGCREAPKRPAVGETTATIRAIPEPDSMAVRATMKQDSPSAPPNVHKSQTTRPRGSVLRDSIGAQILDGGRRSRSPESRPFFGRVGPHTSTSPMDSTPV